MMLDELRWAFAKREPGAPNGRPFTRADSIFWGIAGGATVIGVAVLVLAMLSLVGSDVRLPDYAWAVAACWVYLLVGYGAVRIWQGRKERNGYRRAGTLETLVWSWFLAVMPLCIGVVGLVLMLFDEQEATWNLVISAAVAVMLVSAAALGLLAVWGWLSRLLRGINAVCANCGEFVPARNIVGHTLDCRIAGRQRGKRRASRKQDRSRRG